MPIAVPEIGIAPAVSRLLLLPLALDAAPTGDRLLVTAMLFGENLDARAIPERSSGGGATLFMPWLGDDPLPAFAVTLTGEVEETVGGRCVGS